MDLHELGKGPIYRFKLNKCYKVYMQARFAFSSTKNAGCKGKKPAHPWIIAFKPNPASNLILCFRIFRHSLQTQDLYKGDL
jgi:hypothetical protein